MAQLGTLPPELFEQQQDVSRQQRMAQMLMQQGMQTPQGQIVGGRYVPPSIFQNLANLANVYVGTRLEKEADKKQLEMAQRLREGQSKAVKEYFEATQGSPEQIIEMAGPYGKGMGEEGQDIPAPILYKPEKKPDFQQAIQIANDPYAPSWLKQNVAEMLKPQKVSEGERVIRFNPVTGKNEVVAEGGEKLTENQRNYLQAQKEGYQGTFFDYQRDLKKAGATNVDLSNLLGKSGAGQVGEILKESKIAATGAVQTADAANRIISAVESGKIITGPSANVRLGIAQVSQLLGAGGATQAEMIANSRQAMQGLAQLTLQGRKQMRGEGSITESEGRLAERAIGGDINFTAAEIKQLAEAARRAAKFTYQQHEGMVNTLQADPQNKSLVPFYQIQANPSIFEPQSKNRTPSAVRQQADEILGK
jgi:hypothetical protein